MVQGYKRWLGAAAALLAATAWAAERPDAGVVELGAPVEQAALETHRGGDRSLELMLQDVEAQLHHNKAYGNENGSNYIDNGSFAGASGFPVAVQNTGNNVIIQNAFIIKLDVK